jgi:dynein heavy chain
MYLKSIFASGDIKEHLAAENQQLTDVQDNFNQWFTFVMVKNDRNPNSLIHIKSNRQALEDFKKNNTMLEVIQKNLENYLEKKRLLFPRF